MQRSIKTLVTTLVLALALGALPALAADAAGVVNINTAGVEELSLLPRVGPAVAERIVAFRDENGRFESAEDLMLVRGIGERTYALLESFVATEGETTLSEKVRPSELESGDGGR
jgi:competence protein ComEA